ncbi:hypothetical protein AAIH69_06300 [Paenibacillus sp. MABNS29]|uniref:hypothetical protein n=1 Tax=Paenibacillus sp. MABNS29 TaxID=3142627 RepID=UPI003D291FBA
MNNSDICEVLCNTEPDSGMNSKLHLAKSKKVIGRKSVLRHLNGSASVALFSGAVPQLNTETNFYQEKNQLVITNLEQLIRSALNRIQKTQTPPVIPVDPGIMITDEAHDFIEIFLSRMEDAILSEI